MNPVVLSSEQNFTHKIPFQIRSYEVDQHGECSISNICNYFQEAAGVHAEKLGFDISHLRKKGLTWILHRMQVHVFQFPRRWQDVSVTTWPSSGDGLRAYRDYELKNSNDEVIANGLSHWMMIDFKRRRPVRIPEKLMKFQRDDGYHVMEVNKEKLPVVENTNSEQISKIGTNDLDMNNHVNNVKYIEFLTGYSGSQSNRHNKKCCAIDVSYLLETSMNDTIWITENSDGGAENNVARTLYRGSDKKAIATGLLHFK